MKKSDVKMLKKNQKVLCGGLLWKFHSASPVVKGIGKDADKKLKSGKCDYYSLALKAIDGNDYPIVGQYAPSNMYLTKQYWLGIYANHKDVEIVEEA